jgi:hypothetical protein
MSVTATTTLTFWTCSEAMMFSLPGFCAVGNLKNLPSTIQPGNHIIIKDQITSESLVLEAIYRVLAAGSIPQIYLSRTPSDILAPSEPTAGKELLEHYTFYSHDYRDYFDVLKDKGIEIEAARNVAAVILTYSKSPSLDLEVLRQRAKVSSYDWNNIVKETKLTLSQQRKLNENKNAIGSTDSRFSTDSCNQDSVRFSSTVSSVIEILNLGFTDYEEQQLLEDIQQECGLSKSVFWKIVSSQKNQIDSLQPGDEIRLNNLINWHNNTLDFDKALPCMAADIKHDADIRGIDPIMIWQVLLPAVLSQVGTKVKLDVESHTVPCIAYTVAVAESGAGKSRADDLVLAPLRDLQIQYNSQYTHEVEEWKKVCANLQKDEEKPKKPVPRKIIYEIATIQAVMRRSSEQEPGGQLWSRDEIAGLFKSLGQFGKGENEAVECLLKAFEGSYTQVDRVNEDDSYSSARIAISLNGGIQPGKYREIFKDPNDSQGLTARILFAHTKPREPKRVKGYCHLSESLPLLYSWLRRLPEGTIKLSKAADALYDKLYNEIGKQAFETSQPAIRAWLFKLMGSNLLRVALGLHFIECYHDQNRPIWELQKDTLERAVLFAQYYRSAFHIIQETTTDSDDISSILLKIWDAAASKHPDGITTRDAYRNINAIKYRAKDSGREISAYTAELFGLLEAKGKGKVVRNGRTIKFIANLGGGEPPRPDITPLTPVNPPQPDAALPPPPPNPPQPTQQVQEPQFTPITVVVESEKVPSNEEVKVKEIINIPNANAKLTVAVMPTSPEPELSVQNQVSVTTVPDFASETPTVVEPVPFRQDVIESTSEKWFQDSLTGEMINVASQPESGDWVEVNSPFINIEQFDNEPEAGEPIVGF